MDINACQNICAFAFLDISPVEMFVTHQNQCLGNFVPCRTWQNMLQKMFANFLDSRNLQTFQHHEFSTYTVIISNNIHVRNIILTCLWCARLLLWRCRNLSQSAHRLPQSKHKMIAGVSPSSWLSQVGRGCPWVPLGLLTHSPEVRRSTWSWFRTHREASANHT